jgi:hypothetical protein
MPFDPENPFVTTDPSEWLRIRALPHIIVHPKPPPNAPASNGIDDGPDDWFVPNGAPVDASYPDDWFVPTPSATPSRAQPAPGAPAAATNPGISNPPATRPDPLAAYWALIPASRVGAMAWDPPIFPGNSLTSSPDTSVTTGWPPAPSLAAGLPNVSTSVRPPGPLAHLTSTSPDPGSSIPPGGLLGSLANLGRSGPGGSWIPPGGLLGALASLGSSSPGPGSSIPAGGLLGALAQLGPSSPGAGSLFPSPSQPQSADAQTGSPIGRRPIADFSTGDILGDAAKSFGVGVGRFGIQSAGLLGDAREMLANGAQRAADYFAPGSAPNAGSRVSKFLASHPLLAGPTSSQLQNAVELYTGPFYQPKTIVGDYAQTAGEFVPGAALMAGGGLARSALRYGLLPALSSETAGQLTKNTPAEPWARTLGTILGASPSAWRDLPWARSASDVAETLAQGELSAAEQLAARRRAQLEVNKTAGAEFENQTAAGLEQIGANIARQVTLKTQSGLSTRIDFLSQGPGSGEIRCLECKASVTARETANQKKAFKEIAESGATIVGAGKPGYEGGMKIPATKVEILRP